MRNTKSQIVIVGGGLAGLTAAIHLATAAFKVTLIEKEAYPMHKVCGEYISNEVLPYLESLGIDVTALRAVSISKLQISTQKGKMLHSNLPMGGFGVSRYALDYHLHDKAVQSGVNVQQDEVTTIKFNSTVFEIATASGKEFLADFVIGAYGKRSALDYSLKRNFSIKKAPWLGVKAHYNAKIPTDTVQLHNFDGGYCGISQVENERVNVCYLVHYESFKRYKSIPKFQEAVLYKNPYLAQFFDQATSVFENPLTIAQVNFSTKKRVENHILMCGDAAGLIHPLCGNGMAMAIVGAKLVAETLLEYAKEGIDNRSEVEKMYTARWQEYFKNRLAVGRILQNVLIQPTMQTAAYSIGTVIPSIIPSVVRKTHGTLVKPAILY